MSALPEGFVLPDVGLAVKSHDRVLKARFDAAGEPYDAIGISASSAGEDCQRKIWYNLRWIVQQSKMDGRMQRLMETGEIEETRILDELEAAGFKVWRADENGRQYNARLIGGFVRGKIDGAVQGLLELPPEEVAIVEAKSANAKNWRAIERKGVREAKFLHWVQAQIYARYYDVRYILYVCVNKDTDELHYEILKRDDAEIDRLIDRLTATIKSDNAPARVSDDPEFYQCKYMCHNKAVCHGGELPARRTCRSCIHSEPIVTESRQPIFECTKWGEPLGIGEQKAGCGSHRFLPTLIAGEQVDFDMDTEVITYKLAADGEKWDDCGPDAADFEDSDVIEDGEA